MRWRGDRQSENIEDRRRMGGGQVAAGGGIGVILIAIVISLLGGNPQQFLQQAKQNAPAAAGAGGGQGEPLTAEEEEAGQFVATVMGYSEDVWNGLFRQAGRQYEEPVLVLFKNEVNSGCGRASSGTGPFYCPADKKVYLDTSFFAQLDRQLGAPGDFAQAYVVAHEVGHHVQNLLGYTDQMEQLRRQVSELEYNKYSVKLELQADFFAGVMLHHTQKMRDIIEDGDIEEALRAARAIGDDTLQKRSRGYVQPETFNHGTSDQRLRWFSKGLKTGDLNQGDTFSATEL